MKTNTFCIISTTTDDENIANLIADTLLQKHLVACVQSHTIQSQYHWQGVLEKSHETVLQMKSKVSLFGEIKAEIEALHAYDVPEIIMTPILDANPEYLEWIEKEIE